MSTNLTIVRLQKEELRLAKNPIKNAVVRRKGLLNFHFVVFGLDGDYAGGYYHGVLELPSDYPFSPPKLKFMTPSGRFEVDTPICTTFTNFHRESWSTAWNVETLVLATISFLQSEENALGVKQSSSAERRRYASESMANNLNNSDFVELFSGEEFMRPHLQQPRQPLEVESPLRREPTVPARATASHLPMLALAVLVVGYIYFKLS